MKIAVTEIKGETLRLSAYLSSHPIELKLEVGKGQKLNLTVEEAKNLHRQLGGILYPL